MIRPLVLSLLLVCLAAGAVGATQVGEDYWISVGLYPVVAAQYQIKADPAGKRADALLGGGFGVGHASGFAWQALIEGGGLPVEDAGQFRLEGRVGYYYVTIGPSFADTVAPRTLPTLGPAVAFDWPFLFGGEQQPTARVHQLGVFYRLDLPVGKNSRDFQLRQQLGVRFLFDLPELRRMFLHTDTPWPGPFLNH